MSGKHTEIGDLTQALDQLNDMEPEGHSHNKNSENVKKERVRVGSEHVGGEGDILDKYIRWTCERCGEVVDEIDIRNG